jgi:5-formyltetrahydrofolate cyclo-ligase
MSDVKAAHRTALGAARGALAPETVATASRAIAARICELRPFIEGPALLLYSAIAGEVDTESIRAVAERRGTPVYYPRLQPDKKDIDFVRVRPGEFLQCGPWNIAQPTGNERFRPGEPALLVVPGVGFDRRGTRLGRGGGHYDRAIRRYRPPVAVVGLAFAVQVVAALPRCEWDEPVDCIVTELEVVECVGASTRHARVPAGSE